jgi:RHS repeat-associated protein
VWLEERPSSLPADYFFTAKEFDPETGFYNFGARYLDPRFSKWMTADPALGSYLPDAGIANASLPGVGGAFRPTNLAVYGYGHQNPATLIDPDGQAAVPCNQLGINGFLFSGNCATARAEAANPYNSGRVEEGAFGVEDIATLGGKAAVAGILKAGLKAATREVEEEVLHGGWRLFTKVGLRETTGWFDYAKARWVNRASVWKLGNQARGEIIERVVAETEYPGFKWVGALEGGFHQGYDLVGPGMVVSIRSKMGQNIIKNARSEILKFKNTVETTNIRRYDLRVPREALNTRQVDELKEFGKLHGIDVTVREFH